MRGLRQKLRNLRSHPSSAPPTSEQANSGTAAEAVAAASPDAQNPSRDTIRVQSVVWSEAYHDVKKDEPGIVDAYEKILSGQLVSGTLAIEVEGCPENIIKTTTERQIHLKKLIEDGQTRTECLATVKGKVNDVIEPFNRLRSIISLAVKNDPVASIAWVGITAVLDVCSAYPVTALACYFYTEAH